ncbi:MAG TPA: VTT domain-containing protein [Planctomycetota bacterium]|nr:VTT domain-containing protein [Planctomycetota bacterium]
MHDLIELYRKLVNADQLVLLLSQWSGLLVYGVCTLIIFIETGLFCFFLPGDSLLFIAGFVAGTTGNVNLVFLNLALAAAAIAGDTLSYWIGYASGPRLFTRPKSLIFRPDYLRQAQEFYERNGPKTIVIARFVPIIRTFAPVVAGIGRMRYGKFVSYNVFGGIGWVASLTVLGYFLGGLDVVRRHIDAWVLGIIVLSVLPGIVEVLRARRRAMQPQPKPAERLDAPPAKT